MQRPLIALFGLSLLAGGCQSYEFAYKPDTDRQGSHLRFEVEQPSKADILFVIDNSISMTQEQVALADSIDVLLQALAPQDTRYRIGITSTDAIGYDADCTGATSEFINGENFGARGDCARPEVQLRRPHDGALGRLVGAYDPEIFDLNHPNNPLFGESDDFDPDLKPILARALPTGPYTHPADPDAYDFEDFPGFKGKEGVRWVIDRETIRLEACQACACTTPEVTSDECTDADGCDLACSEDAPCFDDCVAHIAPKLVEAYFRANVAGLGIGGQGWEQGLKSAALAVGIDPEDPNDETALEPTVNLIAPGPNGANTFQVRRDVVHGCRVGSMGCTCSVGGVCDQGLTCIGAQCVGPTSWLRDEALLAVMMVSDEEDCSMPEPIWQNHCEFETGCGTGWVAPPGWVSQPEGSLCYQEDVQSLLLPPTRTAQLLLQRKGGSASRVAVGFIGGVTQVGEHRIGAATDCASGPSGPTNDCSCLDHNWGDVTDPLNADVAATCNGWCAFTQDDLGICDYPPPDNPPYCKALAGSRYLTFTNTFRRRTFESVCRAEAGLGFGDAMAKFAQIATLACFELDGVAPAGSPPNPDLIVVKRSSKAEVEAGIRPSLLPRGDPNTLEAGWYFDTDDNVPRICLTGIDRLIGDVYDIFVLSTDKLDYNN